MTTLTTTGSTRIKNSLLALSISSGPLYGLIIGKKLFMLSIVIPSRNEVYLDRTVKDLIAKAVGPIEVIVVLDGYDTERTPGVNYVYHPVAVGMKEAINSGVAEA